MSKTIVVAGYGPGISKAVAEKFGAEGFSVALVARNAERLAAGVAALQAKGVKAAAFPTDLGDPEAVRALLGKVREALGPVSVLHWNAYATGAGDLTTVGSAELRTAFDLPVVSLVAAVQAALPDLRAERGAVLVTNGGLGLFNPQVDKAAVDWNVMGLGVVNAAKHKLVRLLALKLAAEQVFVADVLVLGQVKGTPWDSGNATLEGSKVADKFWEVYSARTEHSATVS